MEKFQDEFARVVGDQAAVLTHGVSRLLPREVLVDVVLTDEDLTTKAVEFLERLAPFGIGNSEPSALIGAWKIKGMRTLKERHLKIQFTFAENKNMEGFWANGVGKLEEDQSGNFDVLCLPQINTFRNLNRLELKIKHIRASN